MKRKVGIVTFHNHINYGAALQAYGLKYTLEKMGLEPYFICDKRKGNKLSGCQTEEAPGKDAAAAAEGKQESIAATEPAKSGVDALRSRSLQFQEMQKGLFRAFAAQNFRETDLTKESDLNEEFDFFVAGSDQIWNCEVTGVEPFWFLDFARKEKRFSYAASFGMDALPERGKMWYKERLRNFSAISVREKSGRGIVRELLDKEAVVCPDPVFLPEIEDWKALMKPCEEAVVVYMTEFDMGLYRAAQKHADNLKIPFVYIGYTNFCIPGFKLTVCDPAEWLGYLFHAKVIFTNSFHGTVFGAFFHKRLYFKPLIQLAKRNNRVNNLMESLHAEQRPCGDMPNIYEVVFPEGWERTDERVAGLRDMGKAYLSAVVNNVILEERRGNMKED